MSIISIAQGSILFSGCSVLTPWVSPAQLDTHQCWFPFSTKTPSSFSLPRGSAKAKSVAPQNRRDEPESCRRLPSEPPTGCVNKDLASKPIRIVSEGLQQQCILGWREGGGQITDEKLYSLDL